ncbi:Polynucleotidyl transferase- ribonuclease H-like superfamily protein, partial [Striga hermonthica]
MTSNFLFPTGSVVIRGLARVWSHVTKGVRWSLGSGTRALFWWDNWSNSPSPLINRVHGVIPEDQLSWSVSKCVNEHGQWNWPSFSSWLQPSDLLRISATLPPQAGAGQDKIFWGLSSNGQFTTKSAYKSLIPANRDEKRRLWSLIWKWVGPQRIRQFLWLVAMEKLLTNEERHRRHLVDIPLCEICQAQTESILHVLRDCEVSRLFWKKLVPRSKWPEFFDLTLANWLELNLSPRLNIADDNWDCVFGVSLWRLWHGRNNFVFNNTTSSADGKVME